MRKVKFILDRNSLQKLYFSFIRPVLEYADVIWDNIPDYVSLKIENIQLEALRIVTGGNRLASKTPQYKEQAGFRYLSVGKATGLFFCLKVSTAKFQIIF